MRRAFVIVIDACGAGELPDSGAYGDAGANTLAHVAEAAGGLDLPVMQSLGLGNIMFLHGVAPAAEPVVHGRLYPLGPGKDTITGHWELMGVVTPAALRTYPDGFPTEVPLAELYAACAAAREIMTGEHAVGRVIARPFTGSPGAFVRTEHRRDIALDPPSRSYLQELQAAGVPVHTVGKIGQVFNSVGVDEQHKGSTNATALHATERLIDELDGGLVFTNLVETDQVFGHRNDVAGFHGALRGIDAALAGWLDRLDPHRDLLVLTADHGCDPTHPGTDHTREHAPLLARFAGHGGRRHDGPFADVGASVLRWLAGREAAALPGEPFVP